MMRLTKVHIKNYRSVEDSQEFEVDGVTCLVGKNEAGKTAVLQALATLRPYDGKDAQYNKINDYPRRFLNDYGERHPGEEAVVAKTHWVMEDDDKVALEKKFGDGFVSSKNVIISGRYDCISRWSINVNQQATVKKLISKHKLDATEQAGIKACQTTEEAHRILDTLQAPTEKQTALMQEIAEFRRQSVVYEAIDFLSERTPRFLYFSHYDRMNGQVSIGKMKNDKEQNNIEEGDQVFLDFLEYAGTTLDEICSADTYENLNAQCEGASNRITDQLMEYWKQNPHLEVKVEITKAESGDDPPFDTGNVARARVRNTLHRVTVPFSERSAGFIWFFSFLVKFTQVKKKYNNVIILLDEPGLTLHGKAQEDLLRYIEEKLEPHHQIIFSTHSPFMVPVDRMKDVRIVEDVVESQGGGQSIIHGTKVRADVMATDPDTLFPLQGALGYDLAQNLFISPHNLVVEGTSDFTYLTLLSNHLKEADRTGLDERWSIVPVGTASAVPTFVALLGRHLDVTVLVDSQKKGHQRLMALADHGLLNRQRILMVGDITQQPLADIEDLFSTDDFLMLYNMAFSDKKVKSDDLTGADQIVDRISRRIGENFDHGRPADVLLRKHTDLLPRFGDETLSNFERLFESINETLKN